MPIYLSTYLCYLSLCSECIYSNYLYLNAQVYRDPIIWLVVTTDSHMCILVPRLIIPNIEWMEDLQDTRDSLKSKRTNGFVDFHFKQSIDIAELCRVFTHRIGLWENLQENPIFDGKNHGFL